MITLNYKTYGSGEVLFILHGFLGSLDNWHTLAGQFGQHMHVIAIDHRNHGKSPHTESHSISLMAEDMIQLMDQLGIESAHVLGHSMGGKVAMQLALEHPDRIKSLVVVDIAPRQYQRGHDDVFQAIFAVQTESIQSRKEAEQQMLPYLHDAGTRQFLLKNLERTESGGFEWKMNLKVLHEYYQEVIAPIESDHPYEGPVLVIRGGNSRYVRDEDRLDFVRLFPNVSIATIEGAGHWVHAEKPYELLSLIKDFVLNEHL